MESRQECHDSEKVQHGYKQENKRSMWQCGWPDYGGCGEMSVSGKSGDITETLQMLQIPILAYPIAQVADQRVSTTCSVVEFVPWHGWDK